MNEAENMIELNVRGELVLPIRKKIWRSFGSYQSNPDSDNITVGLKRRTRLAILCVKKVISIWEKVADDDDRPLEMIDLAERYIEGSINYSYIYKRWNDFVTDLIYLASDEAFLYAAEVVFASTKAVGIVLKDEELIRYEKDTQLDENLDSFTWDASYFSAIAYSGSGPWDNTNIEKRREFWLWYINEAVPQAYLAYED